MQVLAVPETLAFGPFVLDLPARALFAGGEKLTLSSRAFDILALLVAERDRVVSKDEILTKVWRGVSVEENNLAVQMSSLRRVLSEYADGQTVILTVPGQGYRFVARLDAPPVSSKPASPDLAVKQALPLPPPSPPAPHPAPRPARTWI
jgi:DNA-binding winged helix-turn-helix (wHTH) protein